MSSSGTQLIDDIFAATNHFARIYRLKFDRPLLMGNDIYGQAKHGGNPGIVCRKLIDPHHINQLGVVQPYHYYVIFRRYYWDGWARHCGLSTAHPDYNSPGVMIAVEIYDNMQHSSEKDNVLSELIIVGRSPDFTNNVSRYLYLDIKSYVTKNNTFKEHQTYPGQIELGIPQKISIPW